MQVRLFQNNAQIPPSRRSEQENMFSTLAVVVGAPISTSWTTWCRRRHRSPTFKQASFVAVLSRIQQKLARTETWQDTPTSWSMSDEPQITVIARVPSFLLALLHGNRLL